MKLKECRSLYKNKTLIETYTKGGQLAIILINYGQLRNIFKERVGRTI